MFQHQHQHPNQHQNQNQHQHPHPHQHQHRHQHQHQHHPHLHRQASSSGPPGGASVSAAGMGPAPPGTSWVALKTYPSRQPGQGYRGTRFNRLTRKWMSLVSYQGSEVEIGSFAHEEDAAYAHDRKTVELYGATSPLNFPYMGLVDQRTMEVYRLRMPAGQEIAVSIPSGGSEKPQKVPMNAPPEQHHHRHSGPSRSSSVYGVVSGGMARTNRHLSGADAARQHSHPGHHSHPRPSPHHHGLPSKASKMASVPSEEGLEGLDEWMPRSEHAYTAEDHVSVANAMEHDASLVYEIVFPREGPLGLNLRSYAATPPAGARSGAPLYGCLEVLEAQSRYLQAVVEPGDYLLAVNGKKLCGAKFSFENAIGICSKAPTPRVLRFGRMKGASAAELECALAGKACAVFDAMDGPPQRLVTAQLHPAAPPYFHLNPPTRQNAAPLKASGPIQRSGAGPKGIPAGGISRSTTELPFARTIAPMAQMAPMAPISPMAPMAPMSAMVPMVPGAGGLLPLKVGARNGGAILQQQSPAG